MVMVLGGLMLGVGLAFKLSAFPFHFWCPDVFEGAAAEVGAFALDAGSSDGALLIALPAGAFTLVVEDAGASGDQGEVLVEIYRVTPKP